MTGLIEDRGSGLPHMRHARATDADAIASLHAMSWKTHYRGAYSDTYLDGPVNDERRTVWRDRFARPRPGQVVLVVERGTELLGFVCLLVDHDPQLGSFIDNLHVAVPAHGQGLGRGLMHGAGRAMVDAMSPRGCYLYVLASNRAAQGFYDRIGGAVTSREQHREVEGSTVDVLLYSWASAAALIEGTSGGQGSEESLHYGSAGSDEVRS